MYFMGCLKWNLALYWWRAHWTICIIVLLLHSMIERSLAGPWGAWSRPCPSWNVHRWDRGEGPPSFGQFLHLYPAFLYGVDLPLLPSIEFMLSTASTSAPCNSGRSKLSTITSKNAFLTVELLAIGGRWVRLSKSTSIHTSSMMAATVWAMPSSEDACHMQIWEVVDNCIDEVQGGHAKEVKVSPHLRLCPPHIPSFYPQLQKKNPKT